MLKKIVDFVKEEEFKLSLFMDRVYVENYDNVLSLESDLIRLKNSNKTIFIRGKNLVVSRLLDQEILIVGSISGIEIK